jgi:hypothetical protein
MPLVHIVVVFTVLNSDDAYGMVGLVWFFRRII